MTIGEAYTRSGPLMELASYPDWTQEMVAHCDAYKSQVVEHELFARMASAELDEAAHRAFLHGAWPLIEQFPQFMALNLLKIHYGGSAGQDLARRYLIRNIRVEQNHADQWVSWAEASGIARASLLAGREALETTGISQWCWQVCHRAPLEVAMAATNYAIEGATGEWSHNICRQGRYEQLFPESRRNTAMKWLRMHAHYDDTHPWEALEIIATLLGLRPAPQRVAEVRDAICQSHRITQMMLDRCLQVSLKQAATA